ncbi:glutathione S-transferase family protein [Microvirga subterranea]|uniref:Glutathione S-transferase/RNA polymerase-associated protein n=1 Tax=Microvirga subterranea TaxID=186651 RepID=A0A370HKN9_9HYPH|nr:glutathione S-transferase family protein [Microvirga subterranea]RDI58631.1 glutathione S-transferase/RNA polymerase-associated protein [Microvirga subterranea]
MKLYSGPLSLFSRKVEIALDEKGLAFERVMVPFNQIVGYSPKHPDVVAANPKAQVPVLVDGDLTLYDSTVILEYLEDAYPEPPLFPRLANERAACRLLDLFADEVMLVPIRAFMHRTGPRPDDPQKWEALEAKAREAGAVIERHFAQLETTLGEKPFLCGDLSAADIAAFMSVLFTQRLGGPPLSRHRALSAWFDRLSARPAFARAWAGIVAADRELSAPVEGAYGGSAPAFTVPAAK